MRAPMRPMRPMRPGSPRARNDDLLLATLMPPADHGSQEARNKKEDAIHDAKGPRGLEHTAGLVDGDAVGVHFGLAEDAEGQRVALGGNVAAVVAADAAQVPDAGDEGADEAQVDEGDEVAVGARAVVGEEGADGPHGREDRDDEEDEDRGRGEPVLLVVDVYEVGEHPEGWDLVWERLVEAGGRRTEGKKARGRRGRGSEGVRESKDLRE